MQGISISCLTHRIKINENHNDHVTSSKRSELYNCIHITKLKLQEKNCMLVSQSIHIKFIASSDFRWHKLCN